MTLSASSSVEWTWEKKPSDNINYKWKMLEKIYQCRELTYTSR